MEPSDELQIHHRLRGRLTLFSARGDLLSQFNGLARAVYFPVNAATERGFRGLIFNTMDGRDVLNVVISNKMPERYYQYCNTFEDFRDVRLITRDVKKNEVVRVVISFQIEALGAAFENWLSAHTGVERVYEYGQLPLTEFGALAEREFPRYYGRQPPLDDGIELQSAPHQMFRDEWNNNRVCRDTCIYQSVGELLIHGYDHYFFM
jgi:hypothetical protein